MHFARSLRSISLGLIHFFGGAAMVDPSGKGSLVGKELDLCGRVFRIENIKYVSHEFILS